MILGQTWQMLPSTPVAPLKVSGGYCFCSRWYCQVWNQLYLPSEPLTFPGLCASYGMFDFSKRTRVLILTTVPGATPGCFPLPSLQLRTSPMLVQAPHLFSSRLSLVFRAEQLREALWEVGSPASVRAGSTPGFAACMVRQWPGLKACRHALLPLICQGE